MAFYIPDTVPVGSHAGVDLDQVRAQLPEWVSGQQWGNWAEAVHAADDTVELKSAGGMEGVAHGKPLAMDPETGAVAVPIYMAGAEQDQPGGDSDQAVGATYAEHMHVPTQSNTGEQAEDVIFLSTGGSLRDQGGADPINSSSAYAAKYRRAPWLLHTPQVLGQRAAFFLGVAHGGVVMTGLPGTQGADLLRRYGVQAHELGGVFTGVPPDSRTERGRKDLMAYLLAALAAFDVPRDHPLRIRREDLHIWLADLANLLAADRVARARTQITLITTGRS